MKIKDIKELIELIDEYNLTEFKLEEGDLKLTIRSGHKAGAVLMSSTDVVQPVQQQVLAPAAAAAPNFETKETDSVATDDLIEIKSPIVGTFYRSLAPEKPPFVKVGDTINIGDVVCIVEAMKLFNEIESEVSGKIVKVNIEDASPVEYDQVLFLVDPNG